MFCLGVTLAGFSTLMSSFDRYRWRTIGVVVTVYVLMLILKILGQAIVEIGWTGGRMMAYPFALAERIFPDLKMPKGSAWMFDEISPRFNQHEARLCA